MDIEILELAERKARFILRNSSPAMAVSSGAAENRGGSGGAGVSGSGGTDGGDGTGTS